MKKRTKIQDGIFLVAGIYLVYIAYELFKDMSETTGWTRIALIIAEIVFFVVGVWIAIRSFLAFLPGNQQNESDDTATDDTSEAAEEQSATEIEAEQTEGINDQSVGSEEPEPEESEEERQEEPEEADEDPGGDDEKDSEEQ